MKNYYIFLSLYIIGLHFFSCSDNGLIDSQEARSSENASGNENLTFLTVVDPMELAKGKQVFRQQTLNDIQYVTRQEGGELEVFYRAENSNNDDIFCLVELEILPNTISEDCLVELKLNSAVLTGAIEMCFAPHGILFSEPALLHINAKNLDLSGVDTKKIALYYDNPETGSWKLMKVQSIIIKEKDGSIRIQGGELPHFSRYAVAYSN